MSYSESRSAVARASTLGFFASAASSAARIAARWNTGGMKSRRNFMTRRLLAAPLDLAIAVAHGRAVSGRARRDQPPRIAAPGHRPDGSPEHRREEARHGAAPELDEHRVHAAELRLEPVHGVPRDAQVVRDRIGEEVDAAPLPERVARARGVVSEVLAHEVEEPVEVEAARGVLVLALGEAAREVGPVGGHGLRRGVVGSPPVLPMEPHLPRRAVVRMRPARAASRAGALAPAPRRRGAPVAASRSAVHVLEVMAQIVRRVLLVEDDPGMREAIRALLERAGFSVIVARDGAEAWELLGRGPRPAAILADLHTPRMTGHDLVARVRRTARLAAVPIIVMSARARRTSATRAEAFLEKPFSREQLEWALARVGA